MIHHTRSAWDYVAVAALLIFAALVGQIAADIVLALRGVA